MIHSLKFGSDVVLNNLKLDFSKPGGVYNTIIFAGENGCGKTRLLKTLSDFLNLGSMLPIDEIVYNIDTEIFCISANLAFPNSGFHKRKNLRTGIEQQINNAKINKEKIDSDKYDIRSYGHVYSKSRSGFKTMPIKATTTQDIDRTKYEADENDDFTRIKQLLIDVTQWDNSEWAKHSARGSRLSYHDFKKTSKSYRFEYAFNNFFENKIKYLGYDTKDDNELQIFFEKNGKKIPIDQLSTGEMQIVFRGAHLLKNAQLIKGGFVLIDEPELSLHPKWQKKILQYYRDLFVQDGKQTVQIFIATHSQYVIESAINDNENVLVIALKDDNGNIISQNMSLPVALPNHRASEINYHIFEIESEEYHIELYGYLQYKNSLSSVKETDDFIKSNSKYDSMKHAKSYTYMRPNGNIIIYETLPTYIRNAIDHPDGRTYTQEELAASIKLLIELCK